MSLLLHLFLISLEVTSLTTYPGAQPSSMGGANVGIVEDAYANFYNPAGLAFLKDFSFGVENYTPYIRGTRHYWNLTSALPFRKNLALGVFFSDVNYGKFTNINETGETLGFWSPYDFATGFSIGYKANKFIGTGMCIKYIQSFHYLESFTKFFPSEIFEGGTGRSFAVDIGLLAKHNFSFGKVGIGFAVQNIGPNINYPIPGEINSLPFSLRAGVSYTISAQEAHKNGEEGWFKEWLKEKGRVMIAYDINKVRGEKLWRSFGVEFRPIPLIAIRFGHFNNPYFSNLSRNLLNFSRTEWTKGIGLDFKFLRFDIADDSPLWISDPDRLRFSFSLNIGEPILLKKVTW